MLKKKGLFIFSALIFMTLSVVGQKECYEINVTKGDELYASRQYYEAKKKYEEALKCGYEPENDNLRKRIDNASDCNLAQSRSERYFDDGNYIKAKENYEELHRLNPNDAYAKERIAACQTIIVDQKAQEEKRIVEWKVAEEKEIAERKAKEEQLKVAEEKRQAELKAEEERKLAEKLAEEKRIAEQKAAEEKRLAEQKVEEERKLAEQKAEEEKRLAEKKAEEEKLKAEAEEKRLLQQRTKQLLDRLPASLNVLSSGETKTFSINDYEIPWDILSIPAWCSIEKKENTLILTCEPNTNANVREGSFEIRAGAQSKKVSIKQNRRTSLSVSHNHIEFNSSGEKDTITISTNAASWKTSGLPSWCSMKQVKNALILTCNPNPNTSVREGNFSVQAGDQSVEITVKQKEKIFLELSDNIIKFGKSGGKHNLTVQTNASSWNISNEITWCSTEKTENSIIFSCETNPDTQDRNETFYITAGNESKAVRIMQTDITNLEKGYWKQAIEKVIHFKATSSSGGLFKGSLNGLGVYYFSSTNESYWGELSKRLSNGRGIHILERGGSAFASCPDCQYYAGNWSEDKKSGKGNCYDKTGKLIYSDLFVNDKPDKPFPQPYNGSQSFECIEYENGDIYLGETYNGLRHGLGIFVWANGDTWYGEWKDDKLLNESAIEYQYGGGIKTGKQIGENDPHKQPLIYNFIESNPAITPALAKLNYKGSKVYNNEMELLPTNEIREFMANTNALQLYDKGILYNKIGNISLIAGGGLFITGLVVGLPILYCTNAETAGNTITGIGIGIGAAAILSGVALKLTGIKNIENSVNMYNRTKSARAELRFNFTGNGVCLSLGF